ncbi:cupredoxin domain-containing protein [Kitasatospora sp. NPDC056446]|uniref:cupredoxin domain-containing protein n=1 Tax=Kitasatospora sp. NPDC056446 TaxID=3345819 RepID=UPI00369C12F5
MRTPAVPLRRLVPTGAALLLVCALAACSSGSSGSGKTATASPSAAATATATGTASASASASAGETNASVRITIKNFAFEPAAVTLQPGETVTVTNEDSTAHTLTASDKSFDTGTLAPGATATFTAPQQSGAHPYICTIHPFMHGTLTVS